MGWISPDSLSYLVPHPVSQLAQQGQQSRWIYTLVVQCSADICDVGWVMPMWTRVKEEESQIGHILWMSFMDDPLE